jgi:hypothetical protein
VIVVLDHAKQLTQADAADAGIDETDGRMAVVLGVGALLADRRASMDANHPDRRRPIPNPWSSMAEWLQVDVPGRR